MAEQLTTEQGNEPQVPDALTMSDEDFANMDPSTFEVPVEETADEGEEHLTDQDEPENTDPDSSDDPTSDEEESDETSEESEDEEDADAEAEASDSEDEDGTDEDDEKDTEAEDSEESDSDEDSAEDSDDKDKEEKDTEKDEVDFKAEYEKLMAPFKAAGREMEVRNPDEARRLMQMGADYNRKMAAIKPVRKTMKLLEKHGLLDEQKLGHLIDLSQGNKGAIQKLLKDQGVDPLDFDTNEESDYKPGTYTVDDREVELDSVLEDLKDTPTYQKTLDVVGNKWDEKSQNIIAENPGVLEVLNTHMASGIYERVATEVERQRVFGHLQGMSDLEAYKQIGDRMAEEGAFNDLAQRQTQNEPAPEKKPVVRKPKAKKADPKVKERKRAASSTKSKPASKSPGSYDPLAMSDEEFEKQFAENLLR